MAMPYVQQLTTRLRWHRRLSPYGLCPKVKSIGEADGLCLQGGEGLNTCLDRCTRPGQVLGEERVKGPEMKAGMRRKGKGEGTRNYVQFKKGKEVRGRGVETKWRMGGQHPIPCWTNNNVSHQAMLHVPMLTILRPNTVKSKATEFHTLKCRNTEFNTFYVWNISSYF